MLGCSKRGRFESSSTSREINVIFRLRALYLKKGALTLQNSNPENFTDPFGATGLEYSWLKLKTSILILHINIYQHQEAVISAYSTKSYLLAHLQTLASTVHEPQKNICLPAMFSLISMRPALEMHLVRLLTRSASHMEKNASREIQQSMLFQVVNICQQSTRISEMQLPLQNEGSRHIFLYICYRQNSTVSAAAHSKIMATQV